MEVFVHIGCHKTGTTYLQNMMSANSKMIYEHNLGYIETLEFRKEIFPDAAKKEHPLSYIKGVAQEKFGPALERLLISDENIIGASSGFLRTGVAYKNAEDNLKKLLHPGDNINFFMCIRKPSHFIVSSWAEAIRFTRYVDLQEFAQKVDNRGFSWLDVVRRVKAGLGENPLYIWTYESNGLGIKNLIESYSDGKIMHSDLIELNSKGGRASMSQEGYDLLHLMDKHLGRKVAARHSKRISRKVVSGAAMRKDQILPEELASKWNARYASDLEEIRRIPGVVVQSV